MPYEMGRNGEPDDLFFVKNKVDRPSYGALAIRGTRRKMTYPNPDKGGGGGGRECAIAFRCGSNDHFARDFDIPWRGETAIRLNKGSAVGKGRGPNSGETSGKANTNLEDEWEDDSIPHDRPGD